MRPLVALILCTLFWVSVPSAQSPQRYEWKDLHYEALFSEVGWDGFNCNYAESDIQTAMVRSNRITEELGAPVSEWAGDYGAAGEEVTYGHLRWSPNAGFVYATIYTCLPSIRQLNYGQARELEDAVEITPALSIGRVWNARVPARLIKVKWGEERFLIPESEISSFCDYVAGLGEFNSEWPTPGMFFHQWGEHPRPANELPVLPAAYRHLVKRPIDVSIVSVGEAFVRESDNNWWNDLVTPVTLSAGRSDGVRKGMIFRLLESPSDERAVVVSVEDRTSKAEIVRVTAKPDSDPEITGGESPDVPIRVGWKASTSVHKWLLARE